MCIRDRDAADPDTVPGPPQVGHLGTQILDAGKGKPVNQHGDYHLIGGHQGPHAGQGEALSLIHIYKKARLETKLNLVTAILNLVVALILLYEKLTS